MSEESVGGAPAVAAKVQSLLTDGIIIAVATAFAYLTTFLYEVGYCTGFNIPYSLINPNTSTLLVAAAAIGSIFFTSANLLGLTTPLFRRAKKGSAGWGLMGYLAVGTILMVKIYEPSIKQLGQAVLALLLIVIVAPIVLGLIWEFWKFVWLRIRRSKNPIQGSPSENSENLTPKATSENLQKKEEYFFSADEFLENWLPQKVTRWILLIVGILLFAFIVGNGNARTQKRFLITKVSSELVVLRIYGDVMIAATFDRATKETLNGITVFSISEKKQLDFTNEKIGPLKAKE